jgi:O-antigen/teichoic acid export membrane protein
MCNYASLVGFAAGLIGLWLGFAAGWGLYSMLVGGAATTVLIGLINFVQTRRLRLFPARNRWGKPNGTTFKALFSYGADMFLVMLGLQLITASQAPVISRSLGLEAVAVWSVATKLFTLSQQMVYRLLDFSTAAFSEMIVRGEMERLRARFRDLVILSGSLSVAVGIAMALCNQSFLEIWTGKRIAWPVHNNWLMACSLAVYACTRCHIALACMTKKIGKMKYVYFAEGLAFVGLGLVLASYWGLSGIILSGIVTNLLFSGIYGLWRSRKFFGVSRREMVFGWLRPAAAVFVLLLAGSLVARQLIAPLNAWAELVVCALVAGVGALTCLWKFGLTRHLREELLRRLQSLRAKLGC